MIYNLQDNVTPRRVGRFPKETLLIIQPIAPNPIRIGTSQFELLAVVGGLGDGIQVNPPVVNSDIFEVRWSGWLWIIAVNAGANTQGVIIAPGAEQDIS
jgi:hypothetical protein